MRTTNNYVSYGAASLSLLNALNGQKPTDKDGKITKAEFLNARPNNITRDAATALFAKLDPENTGTVSRSQILGALKGGYAPTAAMASKLSDTSLATLLMRMTANTESAPAKA